MSPVFAVYAALLLLPAPVNAQVPAPGAGDRLREWVTDARAAFAAAPQHGDERVARLAYLQARAGDLAGARETARRLGHSWVPYSHIAIVQRDSGDLAGAIETANLASSMEDRSQALGSLASRLANTSDVDGALSIARSIPWPYQRVESLKMVAKLLGKTDVPRARALLREAVAIAIADTSHWGRYFEVDLAYEQVAVGDFDGALRILNIPVDAPARVERLTRMAMAIRQSAIARRDDIADSLFRVALASVDSIADSTRRSGVRDAAVRAAGPRLGGVPAAVKATAGPGGDRSEVEAIITALASGLRVGFDRENLPSHLEPQVDAMARSAVGIAARASGAFADSIRLGLVRVLARTRMSMARELVDSTGDRRLRSEGIVAIAWELLRGNALRALLPGHLDSSLAYAATADPSPARDEFYAFAVRLLISSRPREARTTAELIGDASRRAIALMEAARWLEPRDTATARAMYVENLSLVDPNGPGFRSDILEGPYLVGGGPLLRSWARSQPTAERRAAAFMAIIEAVAR